MSTPIHDQSEARTFLKLCSSSEYITPANTGCIGTLIPSWDCISTGMQDGSQEAEANIGREREALEVVPFPSSYILYLNFKGL